MKQRVTDRRVQKTQHLLREALVSLIREKPYDVITVNEILDRANVGRSTFYTHFRDKDDLLVSGIHDMLGPVHGARLPSSGSREDRFTWFSLPIFEYHDRHRHTGPPRMGARRQALVHEQLRQALAKLLADEAIHRQSGRRTSADCLPSDLLVQYVASTFILVLNWWLETRSSLRPREVNDLFRSLVLPALAGRE
jgi:AcrR family transcriptional regulator